MAKRVARWPSRPPDWPKPPGVEDVYSVSGCMSKDFADYIPFWKHNGYWLFNSIDSIRSLAAEHSIDLSDCQFFFYEVFEMQFDADAKQWQPFEPEKSLETAVHVPEKKQLEGYDVVTFSERNSPECSPLSCNCLAQTIPVNQHCLLKSLEEARQQIEMGAFANSEPGPYRIFAVHSI
ncbi:MAG TPA: hypothetical protein VMP11_10480 [Verrucomicrobiae bacterium]|nr:hypothetical protein [Verrucomicrobiae bacterium]